MYVSWAASSPQSGLFSPTEVRSEYDLLLQRLEELQSCGAGYLEVRSDSDFPVLTVGFSGDSAVVQKFEGPDSVKVLSAGDPCDTRKSARIPIMDDLVEFDAALVVSSALLRAVVEEFVTAGTISSVGSWISL